MDVEEIRGGYRTVKKRERERERKTQWKREEGGMFFLAFRCGVSAFNYKRAGKVAVVVNSSCTQGKHFTLRTEKPDHLKLQ